MASSFKVKARYTPYLLRFKFDAGTSRGVLRTKKTYLIQLISADFPGTAGYGEAGPLAGLSIDDREDFERQLADVLSEMEQISFPFQETNIMEILTQKVPFQLPSIRFGMETALLDLLNGGKRYLLPNDFYDKGHPIPINGLIWMGDKEFMYRQIREKLEQGFDCIKLKIGSIDFEQECELLASIRKQFDEHEVTLRVDANGAFASAEALGKLGKLAKYKLHSIEQPIQQGNWEEMGALCRNTPVPVALDEELIGIHEPFTKQRLLEEIQPQYIILKPTLLGGIAPSREWIKMAESRNIGWWITSALESNVGLNAIAQFTSSLNPEVPQGLGTGKLYHNNFESPLTMMGGELYYQKEKKWSNLNEVF